MSLEIKNQLEFIKEEKREIFGAWFLGRFLFWDYEIKKSISALKKASQPAIIPILNKILPKL